MALDLYFHPPRLALETLRAPDYRLSPARQRAQRTLVQGLLARHPDCTLQGDALQGTLSGFPGQLSLYPGYLHWSLHGEVDRDAVLAVVEALEADGWHCTDPQEAGFDSRSRRAQALRHWDQLLGARFVGLSLDRNWGARLRIDVEWPDGRSAQADLMHIGRARIPELSTLLHATLSAVDVQGGTFEDIELRFDNGETLRLEGCVSNGGTLTPARRGTSTRD